MKKIIFASALFLAVICFTVYVLLDTFVIIRVYVNESNSFSAYASDDNLAYTDTVNAVKTENSYKDDNVEITVSEYERNNTTIYVADVKLSSASLIKTALAQAAYGRNVTEKTSKIAERAGAILAINGDNYGSRESGYVIRQGTVYRNTPSNNDALAIFADGSFKIINQSEVSANELVENGAVNVFSFGPALVENSEISVSENTEVGKAMASNPRTAIGIIDDLHYVFVVSDGRTNESAGLSLYELAEFMKELGVKTAYNFDGGGSSTLVFGGTVINNPTTNGNSIKERSVTDIVYIGY
ncbi:MAG: phosphodiester glycosidase family protein [Clostridia bacterium]|nr:phosphodiester glycosidase family protein [Clostridia bacterium]